MKIPSRILEAICNDELQAQDFYDVYGKENVINACNQIKLSNEQIKQTYSAEDMKRAVAQKLQYANNNKTLHYLYEKTANTLDTPHIFLAWNVSSSLYPQLLHCRRGMG